MIRTFNYTDRQKILRDRVKLAWIEDDDGPLRFTVELNLDFPDKPLNPAALVILEAYSGSVVMRFSCGTIEHREYPNDTALTDFPPGLKPLFRVKVVEPDAARRLLAWANAVSPLSADEIKSGRRSILPVETVDLGDQVWNLRHESNTFFLQLNSSIHEPRDITVLAREPDFIALVYPAVIRQIIAQLLLGSERNSVEDDHPWIIFSTQLAGTSPPDKEEDLADGTYIDDVERWTKDVIQGFCRQQHAADRFVQFKKEADETNA